MLRLEGRVSGPSRIMPPGSTGPGKVLPAPPPAPVSAAPTPVPMNGLTELLRSLAGLAAARAAAGRPKARTARTVTTTALVPQRTSPIQTRGLPGYGRPMLYQDFDLLHVSVA